MGEFRSSFIASWHLVRMLCTSTSDAAEFYYMMDNNILLPENIEYVRNYDYEILKNENKKTVNIIPKEYINSFVEDFKSTLKGQTQIDY